MAADDGARDGARWAGSVPRLVGLLREEILAAPDRRITFARFMERALTEPHSGYYATSQRRPTRDGDFLTAPELHPFFGRCLGRFLAATWRRAGSPSRYLVREFGAGRGRLRDDALAGLRADSPELLASIEWQSVDLPERSDTTAGEAHVVLANEYLDALPVHRLIRKGAVREAYVGWRDGWFCEIVAEPSSPDVLASLVAERIELREGQRAEVCLAAPRWVSRAAATLGRDGVLLVIDYGHDASELHGPRRMAGSLRTYRRHAAGNDPLTGVGRTDITAHVDVSALQRAARVAGLDLLGRTTQARFLAGLGLADMLSELGRDPATDVAAYLEARSAVARLLDPRHLGGFVVLAWGGRGGGRPADRQPHGGLPGFDAAP